MLPAIQPIRARHSRSISSRVAIGADQGFPLPQNDTGTESPLR